MRKGKQKIRLVATAILSGGGAILSAFLPNIKDSGYANALFVAGLLLSIYGCGAAIMLYLADHRTFTDPPDGISRGDADGLCSLAHDVLPDTPDLERGNIVALGSGLAVKVLTLNQARRVAGWASNRFKSIADELTKLSDLKETALDKDGNVMHPGIRSTLAAIDRFYRWELDEHLVLFDGHIKVVSNMPTLAGMRIGEKLNNLRTFGGDMFKKIARVEDLLPLTAQATADDERHIWSMIERASNELTECVKNLQAFDELITGQLQHCRSVVQHLRV